MAMGGAAFSYTSSLATHSIAGTFGAAGGRFLGRRSRCTRNALCAGLRRAAILGHHRVSARQRSYREGICFRRDAGPQRRDRGARRAIGLERRRRHFLRLGQLSSWLTLQTGSRNVSSKNSASATRSPRPTSRIDRRLADPAPLDAIETMRRQHPFEADREARHGPLGAFRGGGRR